MPRPKRILYVLAGITVLIAGLPWSLPAADTAAIKQGEALFTQNCALCHQADAIGKPGFAPSLTNKEFLSIASDKFIMGTIRDGRTGTGMPPFAHLGRQKIKAIVTYLRSYAKLPDRSVSVDAQKTSQGDPRLGKLWFDQICSTCHGVKGDGYVAGGTGTAIGKIGFLSSATDGFIRTTVKEGRSNTRMLGFQGADGLADMTDQEIDDVIAYLRSLPNR
ncbi:MAG: c-type cytochrome [Gammaproteobacteria bacterium]